MDDKQIAELKAQHGNELTLMETSGKEFVFRKPSRFEYDRWVSTTSKGDGTTAARELVQACCVYPTTSEMFAAIDDKPAILQTTNGFVDAVLELAGYEKGGIVAVKKKL